MESYNELENKLNVLFEDNDVIFFVGTSSTGKSTLVEKLCKNNSKYMGIQFDDYLLDNYYQGLKNNIEKTEFEKLNEYFGTHIFYYIRHCYCKENNNPFILKFKH